MPQDEGCNRLPPVPALLSVHISVSAFSYFCILLFVILVPTRIFIHTSKLYLPVARYGSKNISLLRLFFVITGASFLYRFPETEILSSKSVPETAATMLTSNVATTIVFFIGYISFQYCIIHPFTGLQSYF